MENKEDLTGFNVIYTVTQATGALLVLLVLIWCDKYRGGFAWAQPASRFNWHPLLMTVGMVFLFANSIMIYRGLRSMRKKQLKLVHAGTHSVIVVMILIAQIAVISFHNQLNIPNFYSLHSWLGILTMLIFFFQYALGLVAFLFPGLSAPVRAAMMPYHIYFGITAFVLAIATSLMGVTEKVFFVLDKPEMPADQKYSSLPAEGVLVNVIGMLFAIFGILVVYMVTHAGYKRYPRPEDNVLLTGVSE
ncbi:cytochrome b reductase 1 isoform X3 [Nilaparvata lugens]|nr:cytochrome b reductase 1 isoform X2 [Nilaparvata lugens]XP_039293020.1 cytochrome b reductase 1 isoform X3 [Nilaparvata lugens]XP_039293026.1 cytochrome b reductase 1 isoform X3 [Nilaparvata lugens]XP_039293029.1 cytochrome b reductase 1 isoform X3 [Nilaparvata lugens]XP_039293032.1 cytochrome b reductase 1 isoform X3 [Nilaparvata lugens]XP_039293038.1 cytochrome b reductase 1 isoform X3 [Nilaparvata lugens]XP_039293045.1 cytochrome b reductase 1 isoform X3 [Nilaparvata lugens]